MTATTARRPHGYARYRLDGCRCYTCAWARSEYDRKRSQAIAAGTWQPWTDAQPVRDHLVKLRTAGLGLRRIAELAGTTRNSLDALLHGRRGNPPSPRVRSEIAGRILAVPASAPEKAADKAVIDGTGTARRIQALCCLGWSLTAQAQAVGWAVGNYAPLAKPGPVTARTARLVGELYDELSMRPAPDSVPARRARAFAAGKGWVPPLEWDDETIDDPAAMPASTPANGPELLRAWLVNYCDAEAMGLNRKQIAKRLKTTPTSIKDRLLRARRNGLLPPQQSLTTSRSIR
jgi:transcriptional regulator with XRE-family HTH domain